jgi:hypothetical protein
MFAGCMGASTMSLARAPPPPAPSAPYPTPDIPFAQDAIRFADRTQEARHERDEPPQYRR